MTPSPTPYRPYLHLHSNPQGPSDSRPTAKQILQDCDALGSLTGKNVVITGASGGLGLATAKALYETGARLFLTAREMGRMEREVEGMGRERLVKVEMHLDDLGSVRKGAEEIKEKIGSGGKLDVLICNAGIGGAPLGKTKDGFEMHMGVNHYSHFLLFHLLKPLLLNRSSADSPARIVFLTSAAHLVSGIDFDSLPYPPDETTYSGLHAYAQSKTANIWTANTIHRKYNLTALSVHPGGILETDLARYMDPIEFRKIATTVTPAHLFKSLEQGAATTVFAAVSTHFDDIENGGRYLADCGEGLPVPEELAGQLKEGPWFARHAFGDEEAEERLWRESCEVVGLDGE